MGNVEIHKVKQLLERTSDLVKFQKEMEVLKGERFNIFSILQMEHYEEKTHSAFIRELLDPKGSHLMGGVFLKRFIGMLASKEINSIETHLTFPVKKVVTEIGVGKRDVLEKTGGQIDLYIEGKRGKTLYIENKIYAGDQEAQLVRYFNHKKEDNVLLYLTLYGSEPSRDSITQKDKSLLVNGKDYHLLSYKEDIASWLNDCLKEAAEQPILRESIKQYLILIKKLTNTMAESEEEKLKKLILDNLDASRFIVHNYGDIIRQIRRDFRDNVMKLLGHKLKEKYGHEYYVESGGEIKTTNAPVWVKAHENDVVHFGIEPFSGSSKSFSRGNLFIGICADSHNYSFNDYDKTFGDTPFWHKVEELKFNDLDVNLEDEVLLKKISKKDSREFLNVITLIVDQCFNFIEQNMNIVAKANAGVAEQKKQPK